MEFFTLSKEPRPVRLPDATRRFAYESLHDHRYGLDTVAVSAVAMDDYPGFAVLSPLDKYDAMIDRIVRDARVRICDGEKISGAATFGTAISHRIPATLNGQPVMASVSHLTVDFETVLRRGIRGIRADVEAAYARYQKEDPSRLPFLASCRRTLASFDVWHERYLAALLEKGDAYRENYETLLRVPENPPSTFREAVQSIWFVFAFLRLCGNWPGIGRIDWLLGSYLDADLAAGRLTLDEARDLLAHFFIKGCEWVKGDCYGSGDAQHYQNIVLGGVDDADRDVTNAVTYLVLDVIEETGISDFPVSVRLSRKTDEKLLRRVAEVMRHGGGILAVYNEDVILPTLEKFGYSREEARRFANDGCWEIQVPGRTYFNYIPFDGLGILQQKTLAAYADTVDYPDFESLYARYVEDLGRRVEEIYVTHVAPHFTDPAPADGAWNWRPHTPCTAISLFEGGCIENGRSYFEGGPVYNVISPHLGGVGDVANSLYAIKKVVFDEKRLSFRDFMAVLRADWAENEPLRQHCLTKYRYFGNDNDEADGIYARLLGDFAAACARFDRKTPYRMPAGISTFGRQLEWSPARLASPHGRRAHEVLAPNCSPTPGTTWEGATAIVRSYCKADLGGMVNGAALDVKVLPSHVTGDEGLDALVSLMRGFVLLGGCFMQPDVADPEVLRAAQEHPEDYQTLSVRVSGWNARFVTLDRGWQDMLIEECER